MINHDIYVLFGIIGGGTSCLPVIFHDILGLRLARCFAVAGILLALLLETFGRHAKLAEEEFAEIAR